MTLALITLHRIVNYGSVLQTYATFKRSDVIACGNYDDMRYAEDYSIFVKLLQFGAKCYNIQKPLVYMRVGQDFYKRRGGFNYLKTILAFNLKLLKSGWMSPLNFTYRSVANICTSLLPNSIRKFIYKKLLRK